MRTGINDGPDRRAYIDNAATHGFLDTIMPNPPPPAGTTADMILRGANSSPSATGQYEIYDIGNNAILAAYSLGQVGTDWNFVTLGGFFGSDTTDMLLRNASTGGFEVYDISNNNITNAAFLGNVGLDWQVMGFGNFCSLGETDMILRNVNTGGVEVYDISNNQITGAAFMGTVGLNWQFSGVGNFSGRGTSDMLLRNSNHRRIGGLRHRQQSDHRRRLHRHGRSGLAVLGRRQFQRRPRRNRSACCATARPAGWRSTTSPTIKSPAPPSSARSGLDWQFAGIAPIHAPGASDLVLRNVNTGAFEVYDIANNQLTGAAPLGRGRLGLAARRLRRRSSDRLDGLAQMAQPLSSCRRWRASAASGAADGLNTAPLGADTSQQTLLTTPQHA